MKIGAYSGTGGDSFSGHNGSAFSTYSHDNDACDTDLCHCAQKYKSGWWFKDCLDSNLNGVNYGTADYTSDPFFGIIWMTFPDSSTPLKSVHMAIHPKISSGKELELHKCIYYLYYT